MRAFTIILLAGICGGKSTIASKFVSRGAKLIDADKIGHQQLMLPEVIEAVRKEWGNSVFNPEGQVDRKKLGSIVFANPLELKKLEAIVAPLISNEITKQLKDLELPYEATNIVILDAPLASETGLLSIARLVIFVDADYQIRKQRAEQIRNWKPGELERREKFQMPLEEKRKLANEVINNNDDASAEKDVDRIWNDLIAGLDGGLGPYAKYSGWLDVTR